MPRLHRRRGTRRGSKSSEAHEHCIAVLDLPEELRAELLGVEKYSDYVIRLALDGPADGRCGWEPKQRPTESELRATWLRVKRYAAGWYTENMPGEEMPDEPWRNNAEITD